LADTALADKRIENGGLCATFVGRFLVRLDQRRLRGHVERLKDGQAVRWRLVDRNDLLFGSFCWRLG